MHNNRVGHDLIYAFRPYVEELHPLNCVFELKTFFVLV